MVLQMVPPFKERSKCTWGGGGRGRAAGRLTVPCLLDRLQAVPTGAPPSGGPRLPAPCLPRRQESGVLILSP